MTEYQFYYAPEDRLVGILHAPTYKKAKEEFFKRYGQYRNLKRQIEVVIGGTI